MKLFNKVVLGIINMCLTAVWVVMFALTLKVIV